jgi:hypothetical protein
MREELILKVLRRIAGDISFTVYQSKAAIDNMYRRKDGIKLQGSGDKIKGAFSINYEGIVMLLTGDICKSAPSILHR